MNRRLVVSKVRSGAVIPLFMIVLCAKLSAAAIEPINLTAFVDGEVGIAIFRGDGQSETGGSISRAGDVNGDGLDDLVVGGDYPLKTYVVFGGAGPGWIRLEDVENGTGGFVIHSRLWPNSTSLSVSGGGDVNGDGLSDIIIGNYAAAPEGNYNAGESYVVFGKSTNEPSDLDDVATGLGGFAIIGHIASMRSGFSVSHAGDVNSDGLDDVIIGAPGASLEDSEVFQAGRTYVVFGKEESAPVDLSEIELGVGGFVVFAQSGGEHSGWDVSGAGDVNRDGFADLVIGAPDSYGRAYVVFGKSSTTPVRLADVATGSGGFAIQSKDTGWRDFAETVAGAGDVNGDGLDDILVADGSAPLSGMHGVGECYLVFGKADGGLVDSDDIALGIGGRVIQGINWGDSTGSDVSAAGDVNGDGLVDILVGSEASDVPWGELQDNNAGKAYIVLGGSYTGPLAVSALEVGLGGFSIFGAFDNFNAGYAVSPAGDTDGDGLAEFLVGAPGYLNFTFVVASPYETPAPRDAVWVDFDYKGWVPVGTELSPCVRLSDAIKMVRPGGDLRIAPGSSNEVLSISKPMTLIAEGPSVRIGQ